MFDFHEKRRIRALFYSKVTAVLLFLVSALLLVSVYGRYEVAKEMEGKLEAKQAELEALRSRASALEAKVEYLENDRGLEEELRNRFDVVKEGEQTVILIDSRENGEKPKTVPAPIEEEKSSEESFFDPLKFWE